MKFFTTALAVFAVMVMSVSIAMSEPGKEKDPLLPRVPEDDLEEAREWKNPFEATPENIAKGKELFNGKATCFTCHGNDGRGDGIAGAALDPGPRNFHNKAFRDKKSPGEYMYVVKNGSEGTGMISYAPGIVTEEEAALIILYERSLADIP